MDFTSLSTVQGLIAGATLAIVQILKCLLKFTDKKQKKYLQLLSVLIGALIGVIMAYTEGCNTWEGMIIGVMSGAMATGVYGAVKNPLKKD